MKSKNYSSMNKKKGSCHHFSHLFTADALKVNIHDKSMYIFSIHDMDFIFLRCCNASYF